MFVSKHFFLVIYKCGIFVTRLLVYCGALIGFPALSIFFISVVFLQLLQMVQVSGRFFEFYIPAEICNIEVTTFGPFHNFSQILI